jgi:hypothetical protein
MPRTQRQQILQLFIGGLILLAPVTFPFPSHATTFVALTTDQEGILAFDSKRTSTLNGRSATASPTCKIVTGNRSLYAIAGMSGFGEQNAYEIIKPLADGTPDSLASIRDVLLAMIQAALPNMSEQDFRQYTNPDVPFTVVLAIIFDKAPLLHEIYFYLNQDRTIQAQIVNDKTPALRFSEEVMKSLVPHNWSELEEKTSLVRSLMSAGIAANSASAKPISIVKVTAYGLQWIETGSCTARRR